MIIIFIIMLKFFLYNSSQGSNCIRYTEVYGPIKTIADLYYKLIIIIYFWSGSITTSKTVIIQL